MNINKKQLVLASQSPRRKRLIAALTNNFIIEPSTVNEVVDSSLSAEEIAVSLATQKARDVAKNHTDKLVLGADTIVVFENKIIGKPKDENDAIATLTMLSGKTHTVITGICLIDGDEVICDYEKSIVTFYPLTQKFIEEYVATGSPMDKAGSYGLQDKDYRLVSKFNGSYTNIVGLPIALVAKYINNR